MYETAASFGRDAAKRAKPPKNKSGYGQLLSRRIQELRGKATLTETEQMRLTNLTEALLKEVKKARRTK